MNERIVSINELKDSKLLFDQNPPKFGYIFILLITAFFAGAIIWSVNTPRIYTIQASGTVTNEDANYVMCTYTGEIDECYMEEGMIVEKGDVLFTVTSTDYDVQEEQLKESKADYEETIEQYELLVKSIKDDTNYFDESDADDELYYSMFESYKAEVEQYTLDTSSYSAYGYTQEQIAQLLETNQGKISAAYYEAINEAESAIEEAQAQIDSIDAQLSAIGSGQSAYQVTATADGVLHMLEDYKSGMVVQTTGTVATITPQNAACEVEAYVSTSDMARMNEGDSVQVVIDGLSQNVYGSISGTVTQIGSDVTSQTADDGTTTQVFKVLVSLDQDYLVSRSGEKVDIENGMTATARIQYDKVTYFNYVLEKLGIKSR